MFYLFFFCAPVCADFSQHPVVELRSSFTRHVNLSSHNHSRIHHFHIPQSAPHPSIRPTICYFVVCVYLLQTGFTSACLCVYFATQPAHRRNCFLLVNHLFPLHPFVCSCLWNQHMEYQIFGVCPHLMSIYFTKLTVMRSFEMHILPGKKAHHRG